MARLQAGASSGSTFCCVSQVGIRRLARRQTSWDTNGLPYAVLSCWLWLKTLQEGAVRHPCLSDPALATQAAAKGRATQTIVEGPAMWHGELSSRLAVRASQYVQQFQSRLLHSGSSSLSNKRMTKCWDLCTCMGERDPGSWFQLSPAPAVVDVWGVKQQMADLYFFLSLSL